MADGSQQAIQGMQIWIDADACPVVIKVNFDDRVVVRQIWIKGQISRYWILKC